MRLPAMAFVALGLAAPSARVMGAKAWYRGNTHAHTNRSDGNASPDDVVRFYRDLGYNFVVLSDHDRLTPVESLDERYGEKGKFLVIPGEEVSAVSDAKPLHLTAVGPSRVVVPSSEGSPAEILDRNAAAILEAGGLPILNHPNLGWFLSVDAIVAAGRIRHFELINPHPVNNSAGGGGWPSTEELWDQVLTRGRVLYGVAADDAHDYESFAPFVSARGPAPRGNPGRAWVMVRASELSSAAIRDALSKGDFYASTGVELEDYAADSRGIRMRLPTSYRYTVDVPGELRYRTYFIGAGGRVLKLDESATPEYEIEGSELYVRARVEASDGTRAWTEPLFPAKGASR